MALTEKQLVELKESVTQAKTRVSELRGQLTALMKQLKDDWECETIEEANEKIETLEKKAKKLAESIKSLTTDLEQKYELQDQDK